MLLRIASDCPRLHLWGGWMALCGCVVTCAIGCAPKTDEIASFLQSREYHAVGTDHRVVPGDKLSFQSPYILELDGTREEVGTDGKVELPLVGKMYVAGLTAREVQEKLDEQLAPFYAERDVLVRIPGRPVSNIYVFGQVHRPGIRQFTGRDTVFDVLMDSQPTFIGWKSQVHVVRASADPDDRRDIVVDFDKMVQKGDLRRNVLLQPGDIVYVPPTPLGWVGLRVRELLFPLEPAFRAYSLPAQAKSAYDVYNDDDDDNSNSNARRAVLLR